jgi:plastocyanin
MKKIVRLFVLVVLTLSLPAIVAPAAGTSRTWTVLTGGGIPGTAIVANAFNPRTIEVAMGDTVKWEFQEPWTIHTVTFPSGQKPPEVDVPEGDRLYFNADVFFLSGGKTYDGTGYRNSGVAPQGPQAPHVSYSLTFTKPGKYDYLCPLHGPAMSGTVLVKERVSGSPAAALARAKKELAATLSAGQAAFAKWNQRQPLVVKRDTTVTWVMRDPFEIHTVIFTGGEKPSRVLILEQQKQGRPKVLENPKVTGATQTKMYDGTGYANSGVLFPPDAPANLPKSFRLTFTKPGKYEHWCAITRLGA